MAVRQYIGARYTTKIYVNSQDPGSCEWESGVVYEPLTIVSYQNSSYLSRTSVPANAGNPATATQYWAQTGFYNGQIAQLQQDILDINGDISDINDDITEIRSLDEMIIIGDSWMDPDEGGATVVPLLAKKLNYATDKIHNYAEGGTGFVKQYGHNFVEQIQSSLTDTNVNPDKVKTIICLGGTNDADISATYAQYVAAINSIQSVVDANYPNSKLYIFFMQGSKTRVYPYSLIKSVSMGCDSNIINMAWPISFNDFADNLHPTTNGYREVARYIASNVLGLKYTARTVKTTFTDQYNTKFTGGRFTMLDANIVANWDENTLKLYCYMRGNTNTSSSSYPFDTLTIPNAGIPILFSGSDNPIDFDVKQVALPAIKLHFNNNELITINGRDAGFSATSFTMDGFAEFIWN